jgi:hypothetical protein
MTATHILATALIGLLVAATTQAQTVETRIGKLDFELGVPTKETVTNLVSRLLLFQILFLLTAQDSHAGVIVWLELSPQIEGGTQRTDHLIEIIQGHKKWLFDSGERFQPISQATYAAVDDLDKGVRTNISYGRKTYSVEAPFPNPVDGAGPQPIGIGELKPTGRFRKVAGYSCEEYLGSRETAHWGHSTEVVCVSHDAPGVQEYSQFMRLLNRLFVTAGYDDGSFGNEFPDIGSPQGIDGVPLEVALTGRVGFAVKRIESKEIPATQFEVPAGFVRNDPD